MPKANKKQTSNQGKTIEPKQNSYIILILIIMIILFNKGKTFSRILTNLIGLCPKLQFRN